MLFQGVLPALTGGWRKKDVCFNSWILVNNPENTCKSKFGIQVKNLENFTSILQGLSGEKVGFWVLYWLYEGCIWDICSQYAGFLHLDVISSLYQDYMQVICW